MMPTRNAPENRPPPPHENTVSLAPVMALANFAIDRGMDQDRVESLIGTPLNQADPNGKIEFVAGPLLFNQILIDGLCDAPTIEMATSAPLAMLGGLERLVLLAPTGREALRALKANFSAFHDGLAADFEETRTYTKFSFKYPGIEHDNGCCNEVVLSFLVKLMRTVFGAHGQPYEVQMRYDRNGTATEYDSFFVSPVRFWSGEDSFSIIYRKDDMDWRQPGHDASLFDLAFTQLSKKASCRGENSPATEYFQLIRASNICAREGLFNVADIAAMAGLSERTAQRIALRHGGSVGKLIDQARLRVLRDQLSQHPKTDAEYLSDLLGYSESRALRRAIKTWTGQSLSMLRAEHLADKE